MSWPKLPTVCNLFPSDEAEALWKEVLEADDARRHGRTERVEVRPDQTDVGRDVEPVQGSDV